MTTITAINKKHQTDVNKAYKLLRQYHELVNQEDNFEPESNAMRRLEDKQAIKFTDHLEIFENLPKREQANFQKQHKNIHGYT